MACRKGDLDAALAEYTEAIRIDPNYARAYYSRAIAYDDKHDQETAIADCTKSIQLDPKSTRTFYLRGLFFRAGGKLEKAIADFTEAIRLDPTTPDEFRAPRCVAAEAYACRAPPTPPGATWTRPLPTSARPCDLRPQDGGTYHQSTARVQAILHDSRGRVHIRKGDPEAAIADSASPSGSLRRRPGLRQPGRRLYAARHEIDKAIADFTEAVRLDPENSRLYSNRGSAYASQGRVRQSRLRPERSHPVGTRNSLRRTTTAASPMRPWASTTRPSPTTTKPCSWIRRMPKPAATGV